MYSQEDVLKLVKAVRELATEFPDNIYGDGSGCHYNAKSCTNGTIGCIIGQGCLRARLPYPYKMQSGILASCMERTQEALWLAALQGQQDRRYPWGECLERANKDYPLESNV